MSHLPENFFQAVQEGKVTYFEYHLLNTVTGWVCKVDGLTKHLDQRLDSIERELVHIQTLIGQTPSKTLQLIGKCKCPRPIKKKPRSKP